jgi:hypothetical protein
MSILVSWIIIGILLHFSVGLCCCFYIWFKSFKPEIIGMKNVGNFVDLDAAIYIFLLCLTFLLGFLSLFSVWYVIIKKVE